MVLERPWGGGIPAELIPTGTFLLTSQHEGKRAGARALGVMLAAREPLMLAVSLRCGHWIEPLIRDSRHFALSRLDEEAGARLALLLKRCDEPSRPRDADVFDLVATSALGTGSPVLESATLAFDCEVVRHMDVEADHEVFVGRVLTARVGASPGTLVEPKPVIKRPATRRH